MYQQIYYIDKSTNTFADSLAVYGLARILYGIMEAMEPDILIQDKGYYYQVDLGRDIRPEWVDNARYFNPVDFILTDKLKKEGACPEGINSTDYEDHKARNAEFYEKRKLLPKEALRPGATVDEFPELASLSPPHPNWEIWAQVNQMSAIAAYNSMVAAWYECKPCFPELLKLILKLCATTPNDVEGALTGWKKLAKARNLSGAPQAAATQVYNPSTGKGANRAKADNLTIGGLDNFWLLEYLKLTGMQYAGIPRVVSGAKDRKTYVLLPKNIKLSTSNRIFKEFQHVLWRDSPIKMDIRAGLKYAQAFLEQWKNGQANDFDRSMGLPDEYVHGLAMAFYKDMGSALAVLNQSTINLPRWTEQVTTKQEADQFTAILEEHEKVIQLLKEDRGPECAMLRTYRDFLSSGNLQDFFEFSALFSSYLTNKIESKDFVNQFTTTNLEVLMKSKNKSLTPILENSGFKNIANAIRQSTVNAQWAKIKGQRVYDVRYGLGLELKRKANYNHEFVQALTDFIQEYNQENVQMAERHGGNPPRRRAQVTTEDLAQVVALIDAYDAKTVGNMLIAFGYARDVKDDKSAETE